MEAQVQNHQQQHTQLDLDACHGSTAFLTLLCIPSGDTGAVGITAALLVLERLLLVISERALLRPVLVCFLSLRL